MYRSVPLLALVSLVAAGGEGYSTPPKENKPAPPPETLHETKYWTETYTKVEKYEYTTTTYVPVPTTYTDTETLPPVTAYVTVTLTQTVVDTVVDTETLPPPEAETVYLTDTATLPPPEAETIYLTDTQTGTVTSLSVSETELTIYITSTETEVPTTIITTTDTTTTTTSTEFCEFCKIEFTATGLVYPYIISTTTVFASTLDIYTTINGIGPNDTTYSTDTIIAPTDCPSSCEPIPTTWEFSGVPLTSGTTYLAYTEFSRAFLEPRSNVYGCGELVSTTLDLGPSSANFAPRILATDAVPTSSFAAPPELLIFLNQDPTVVEQLSGIPAQSCDLPSGTGEDPATPSQTIVVRDTSSTYTTRSHPPTVNNAADILAQYTKTA